MLAPAAAQGRFSCQSWHPVVPFTQPPLAPVRAAGGHRSVTVAAEPPERSSSRGGRGGRSSSGRGRSSRGRGSSRGARGGGRASRGGGSSAGWQRAAAWDSDDDDDDEEGRRAADTGPLRPPDRSASRGRGGGRGGRLPPILRPSSSSSVRRGGGSSSSSSGGTVPADSGDFVVVGRASGRSAGAYIPAAAELAQIQQGGSFWESALADEDEDDEDEEFDDEDDGYDVNDASALVDDDDLEVAFEDIASLMQELAAGLEGGEGEDPAAATWRQVYTGRQAPPLCLGPVAVRSSSGKGRGLFTTSPVAAGALLLVAAPLALLYCEEGTTPEIEDLADALAAAVAASDSSAGGGSGGLAPWQQHALLQLRPASDNAAAAAVGEQQALASLLSLLGPAEEVTLLQQEAAEASDTQQEAAASGTQQQTQQLLEAQQQQETPPASLPNKELLTQLVFANCNGEEGDDEALMLLRGTASSGHLGVWPAAALINHSCSPNCHALLIGDRLVVRAAVDLAAGLELSLSYLGPLLFAPAATRQAELQQQWGFACNCPRCKAEARYSSSLSQLLGEVYAACQAAEPQLQAAVEQEDSQALAGLRGRLQQLQQQLEAALRAAKPPANVRRWLQASVYDLYDLLSLCADQLPQPPASKSSRPAAAAAVETEALAACARIVGATAPGSSAHVDLATEYMVRAEARFGEEHQEAVDATRLCAAATTARYGPCSDGLLQLLMDTRAGAALLSEE